MVGSILGGWAGWAGGWAGWAGALPLGPHRRALGALEGLGATHIAALP